MFLRISDKEDWKLKMEEKKSREKIEKERTEYLDLIKHKQDLENNPTLRPPKRVSGWGSKLKEVKRDRMAEKRTVVRQKTP